MKENFPKRIPIFPLRGVIYFPKTNLPLNIFEERYLQLVTDSMKTNKLMGMIQLKKGASKVYNIGCLGEISHFEKTRDGRILIKLTGITRFEVIKEIKNSKLYREFNVQYDKFYKDIEKEELQNRQEKTLETLFEKIKVFFKRNGLILNWKEFEKLNQAQKISTLAMISPFSEEEKQKLLETVNLNSTINTLSEIVEFYMYEKDLGNKKTFQ